MKKWSTSYLSLILLMSFTIPGISQEDTIRSVRLGMIMDSLRSSGVIINELPHSPDIQLSTGQAIEYLQDKYQKQNWKNTSDPLRYAIGQLIYEASYPPYDSSEIYLKNYEFDSLNIPWDKFNIREPLRLEDTAVLVVIDTLQEVVSGSPGFPFRHYNTPFQGDSVRVAVRTLMDFVEAGDSSIINVTGLGDAVTHVWLNSRADVMKRYWLRNELGDSITVWIGAPSRNTLGLYIEQGVNFRRPVRQGYYSDARIEVQEVDKSTLLEVKAIPVRSQFWKYRTEANFALNQGAVSNWVKGGESSISVSTDVTGYADYTNKDLKLSSNNFARIKFGLLKSGDNDLRKNIDLLETNSKLNHKAFGKFDISGVLLFKTQVANGKSYTRTDTVLVSKFFNPAILTAGIGLDYKPNKKTSINFSPISYKGTFVPDTAMIDQTKYGVAADKKTKNEPGLSFMFTNEFKPLKTVTVTNRLQLFTNYINNPQNIDVDWEMIVTAALNWFTDVRFNTHLIFDDDTKTPVFDDENQPVIDPVTGKQKTTARIQFKELLGFSFVFRF
ncbi:MAG: DUF3078 domain-containing protein [Bacteroidota bacterium]